MRDRRELQREREDLGDLESAPSCRANEQQVRIRGGRVVH